MHRFLARLWRLAAARSPSGRCRASRGCADARATTRELLRKAHWAIDKVTNDMAGRFAFNTAIAAVMELVNEAYRAATSSRRRPATLHFATATAASLIFPFAPHLGARGLRAADRATASGRRRGRRPTRRCWSATSSSWSCRSTASCATASRRPRTPSREELEELRARAAERAGAHRRQGGRQGGRRAWQARQPGGQVGDNRQVPPIRNTPYRRVC